MASAASQEPLTIDCVCGFGDQIREDQHNCPTCGIDVMPLHRLRRVPRAYYALGMRQSSQGDLSGALTSFAAAFALNPGSSATCEALAGAYRQKGMLGEAIVYYERTVSIDPQNTRAEKERFALASEIEAKSTANNPRMSKLSRLSAMAVTGIAVFTFLLGFSVRPVAKRFAGVATPTRDLQAAATRILQAEASESSLKEASLDAQPSGNAIRLTGSVPSVVHRDFAIALARTAAGDIPIVSDVRLNASPPTAESYRVVKGDTLQGIALRKYGSSWEWKRIYEANRHQIASGDRLAVGQTLLIPPANK